MNANLDVTEKASLIPENSNINKEAYAFIAEWNSFSDAQFLAELLKNNIKTRHAKNPFGLDGNQYERGTLIITKADNKNTPDFLNTLSAVAAKHAKTLKATSTGFVEDGKDFGSHSVQPLKQVKVALLSGKPTSTLNFGEIWHFFEQQLQYPVTILDTDYFKNVNLSEYDILIIPDGNNYTKFLSSRRMDELKDWINDGGKLIALGGALKALSKEEKFNLKPKEIDKDSIALVPIYDSQPT
ncbi:hypothetical protein ACU8V7_18680 [Zobellia nedashkovskayae]